ncbi:hypothetical protein MVEN_00283500 [Mycena venus]|uniref:Uncharacterized protein n=1 Tax=Mycena venus TaxID=2733690 RepID=A0A8H7DFH5_9AGAR|nr:hypothetical protein MVEN_00283500 [Mycena venus]
MLPRAAKLPPAVRENVREMYEGHKERFENELSELLGVPWTFDFDPLAIYPYAELQPSDFPKEYLGNVLQIYMAGAVTSLKWLVEKYGDTGRKELNKIAHAHTIELDVGEPEQIVNPFDSGTAVVDGKLAILFKADGFGSMPDYALTQDSLFPALTAASESMSQPMTFLARLGLNMNYGREKTLLEQIRKKFSDMLKKEITLDPNFDKVFAKLLAESKRPGNRLASVLHGWQLEFGLHVSNYFGVAAYQMQSIGFGTDEVLRERFHNLVDSGIIKLRIVDALKRNKDFEVEIKDGVLYVQTTPEKWCLWSHNNNDDIDVGDFA